MTKPEAGHLPSKADDLIIRRGDVKCSSDREACIVAESMIGPGKQVEVWDGTRRVSLIGLSMVSDRPRSIN